MPEPEADLALLTDAAREAGHIAMRFWRNAPRAWDKGEDDPVTEADMAVNAMLATTLRAARPDYGWLSEESPDNPARLSHETAFIIDPIDGTRAFIAGEDTFSHALAVVRSGRVVAATVFLPALDRLYTATADGLAQRDGQPIIVGTRGELEGARMLCSGATLSPENWPGGPPPVRRSFRASLAYRLCLVAEGRHDAMASFRPTWEWDAAAGSLIAERAGAVVTDAEGATLRFNRPRPQIDGLIVAEPAIHAGLMARRRG